MFPSTFSGILPSSFFTYSCIWLFFTLKALFKFLMMLFGWFIFSKEGLDSFGDLIRFKGNRSIFLLWLLSGKQGVEEQSCPHACRKPKFSTDVSFNCFGELSGIFPAGLLQLLTQLSGRGEEVSNDATTLYWGLQWIPKYSFNAIAFHHMLADCEPTLWCYIWPTGSHLLRGPSV